MNRLIIISVMALCAGLAHVGQKSADQIRHDSSIEERFYIPSGEALRVASLGHHTILADLMWVRSVLNFADIYVDPSEHDQQWLVEMLSSVATLDPTWRTIYFHGGSMLRVLGMIDESDALFTRGTEVLPDEPYFVFSLAMNAYLYRDDVETASMYMDRAANIPGAPAWYRSASAGFMSQGGQRQAAIRYLTEQLEQTTDEAVSNSLRKKLMTLIHDDYAAKLEKRREVFRDRIGRDIQSVDELAPLPEDPYGGEWIISIEGDVVSDHMETIRAERAQRQGRRMLTNRKWWNAR